MKIKIGMKQMNMSQLARLCGGEVTTIGEDAPVSFETICTDSREAQFGSLFLAMKGERVDGHAYILDALGNGCGCVLCEYLPETLKRGGLSFSALVVPDTRRALALIAKAYGKHVGQKKVAITGSVGKTTTKEMVASVLTQQYRVHKTQGNFNSMIGMPMTLLEAPIDTQVSVLEMGMGAVGEIDTMSRLVCPDVALITNIGSAHLEALGSRENICSAKMEIVHGLTEDGTLILNGDEPLLWLMKGSSYHPLFVGIKNREADIRAMNIRQNKAGTIFDMIDRGRVVTNMEIPVLGEHNVYNAMFAYAVGVSLGVSTEAIRRGLAQFSNTGMRQNIYRFHDVDVIEDCYNASPESMKAALKVLDSYAAQNGNLRRVALLGDMKELGENSQKMHREVGEAAAASRLDLLITFGDLADDIALGAVMKGMEREKVIVLPEASGKEKVALTLSEHLLPGDCLLVKASRAMALEEVLAHWKGTENAE